VHTICWGIQHEGGAMCCCCVDGGGPDGIRVTVPDVSFVVVVSGHLMQEQVQVQAPEFCWLDTITC
jgi:hypothetical protein